MRCEKKYDTMLMNRIDDSKEKKMGVKTEG
jgi:hypothetical protein